MPKLVNLPPKRVIWYWGCSSGVDTWPRVHEVQTPAPPPPPPQKSYKLSIYVHVSGTLQWLSLTEYQITSQLTKTEEIFISHISIFYTEIVKIWNMC